jgi:hypothetical protein
LEALRNLRQLTFLKFTWHEFADVLLFVRMLVEIAPIGRNRPRRRSLAPTQSTSESAAFKDPPGGEGEVQERFSPRHIKIFLGLIFFAREGADGAGAAAAPPAASCAHHP